MTAPEDRTDASVVTTTTLLHSFNRWSGMCRCGAGPLAASEWVAHYKAQDDPVRTTTSNDGNDK